MPSRGGGKAQRRDGAVIRLNEREEKRRGGGFFCNLKTRMCPLIRETKYLLIE